MNGYKIEWLLNVLAFLIIILIIILIIHETMSAENGMVNLSLNKRWFGFAKKRDLFGT